MLHWRSNDDGVYACAVEKLLRLRQALDVRIQPANMLQALRIQIADGFELAVRKTFEVANQKRSPVTAPNYPDCDWFLHTFRADPQARRICVAGLWLFGAASDRLGRIGVAG
jgi:hypothetical protein